MKAHEQTLDILDISASKRNEILLKHIHIKTHIGFLSSEFRPFYEFLQRVSDKYWTRLSSGTFLSSKGVIV